MRELLAYLIGATTASSYFLAFKYPQVNGNPSDMLSLAVVGTLFALVWIIFNSIIEKE